MARVTIEGGIATTSSPEGLTATMRVGELFGQLSCQPATGGIVLPDGIKAVISREPITIWVHQVPPRIYNFKWIASGSPPYGKGARYRDVKIALPYVVVLAVFARCPDGGFHLGDRSECFFRTESLESLDDSLLYPALLNCSKFVPPEGKPLSWICTQKMDRSGWEGVQENNARMRLAFKTLMHCLLETGFNYSSEQNEANSWYSESSSVDPRISPIEAWETATRENPLFVLEVPWLPVGMNVGEVADRIAHTARATGNRVSSAGDVARHMFNRGSIRTEG
jgi:hypothetical protein